MKKNLSLILLSFVLVSSGIAFGLPQSCKDKTAVKKEIYRLKYAKDKNPIALKKAEARLKLLSKKCEVDKAKLSEQQQQGSSGGFYDAVRRLKEREKQEAMERAGRWDRFKTSASKKYQGAKEKISGWFKREPKPASDVQTSRFGLLKFWKKK